MKIYSLPIIIFSFFICSMAYSSNDRIDGYQDIKFNMTQNEVVELVKNKKNYSRYDDYRVMYHTEIMGYTANVGINFQKNNKNKIENIDIMVHGLEESDVFNKFSTALMKQYPQAKTTEILTENSYLFINKEQSFIFSNGSSITLSNSKSKRDQPGYGFIQYNPKPQNIGL